MEYVYILVDGNSITIGAFPTIDSALAAGIGDKLFSNKSVSIYNTGQWNVYSSGVKTDYTILKKPKQDLTNEENMV